VHIASTTEPDLICSGEVSLYSNRVHNNSLFCIPLLLQVDKYKNISQASEQRLAALELRNKELLATVSSSPTRGKIYSKNCHIGSVMCAHHEQDVVDGFSSSYNPRWERHLYLDFYILTKFPIFQHLLLAAVVH
jgi:hypothetical protein